MADAKEQHSPARRTHQARLRGGGVLQSGAAVSWARTPAKEHSPERLAGPTRRRGRENDNKDVCPATNESFLKEGTAPAHPRATPLDQELNVYRDIRKKELTMTMQHSLRGITIKVSAVGRLNRMFIPERGYFLSLRAVAILSSLYLNWVMAKKKGIVEDDFINYNCYVALFRAMARGPSDIEKLKKANAILNHDLLGEFFTVFDTHSIVDHDYYCQGHMWVVKIFFPSAERLAVASRQCVRTRFKSQLLHWIRLA